MKKLILSAGIMMALLTCFLSCNSGKKSNVQDSTLMAKSNAKPGKVQVTLDGIDSVSARGMIDTFQKYAATYKLNMFNFLVKKDTLHKLVKLLEDEITQQKIENPNTTDTTDGIRFYFAVNPKSPKVITMVTVATRDSTVKGLHYDYYSHSDATDLIKLHLNGGLAYPSTQSKGAALYSHCDTCKDDTLDCDYSKNPHYLKRIVAEAMVQGYSQIPASGVVQTNAEWYPLEMLKEMSVDTKCDGIRIYFARHTTKDPSFPSRACFVITTTHIDSIHPGVYQDYFDCKTLKTYFDGYKKNHPEWRVHPNYPGQDNGSLCPNNCN